MAIFPSANQTTQLFLIWFSIVNILKLANADPPYNVCSTTSSYTTSSPFENNLNSLMSFLPSNASITKLYNTSFGNEPDRIYSQYMCLNYVTNESCSTCITTATSDIRQLCPNDKEAVVWEEICQLRYSNQNFLGHLNVSGNIPKYNEKNISEPERFKMVVNQTLTDLANKAAYLPSTNMYATNNVTFTDSNTIYALVQCTTDLSPNDCHTCLQVALANILSCYFYRGARLLSRSCYLRYELYAFYEGATNESSASQLNQGTGKSHHMWMIIILILGSAIVVIAVLGSFFRFLHAKNRAKNLKKRITRREIQLHKIGKPNNIDFQHQNFQGRDGFNPQESAFMDLASLLAATDNFSDSNMLGQGGFGPVYKGILCDGQELAVKRLSSCSEQGTEEFTNEVLLIMKLQHKNLVKLLGYCVDKEEKILVYEFMPNSSLDVILFDPQKRAQLDWSRRTNIINGIAKGILYLHVDSRHRIIHRDLKPSNVLLDNDMNPKISDFGMARIFAGSEGEANTTRIVGTYGYMAPEFAMEGLYSTKSDVFSFGVLLLEIITGRRNAGFHISNLAPNLLAYVSMAIVD